MSRVFDLYKLEGGKKSLAIEVTLQPKDKTLTEAEIEAVSAEDRAGRHARPPAEH